MDNNEEKSVNDNEASPQTENGHLDIANELVEELAKTQLSGYESRVIWALWRKTWCWVVKDKKGKIIYETTKKGKKQPLKLKSAVISSDEWVELTGLNKYNVSRTLRVLCLRNIIIKFDNRNDWGFQKVYTKWLPPIKRDLLSKWITKPTKLNEDTVIQMDNGIIQMDNGIIQMDNEIIRKLKGDKAEPDAKETLKETLKETIRSEISLNKKEIPFQLATYLDGKIRENNKRIKKRTETQLVKWAKEIERLIRIDEAPPEEIGKVIDWAVKDSFWSDVIESANKLRKHYPKLYKKAIDRGRSLKENLEDDHRFDDLK